MIKRSEVHIHHAKFAPADIVVIDEDDSIKARVLGVAFYDSRTMVLVSWMHQGALHEQWIDEYRLT